METLFAYGTLQNKKIQQQLFNRVLSGKKDSINDYELIEIETEGNQYPCATYKKGSRIEGIVYKLTERELIKADEYEGKKYKRIKIMLNSKKETWVYIKTN